MKKLLIYLVPVFLVSFSSCRNADKYTDETYENYVILVSFDGFRWDYPDMYDTPNFDAMAKNGVKAEGLIPSFPTKTFPNHYTLATGLYPDHHGLINNTFFAPDLGLLYRIGNRDMVQNPDFYGGEPIWNTAERQGVKSASFFWVGSEAKIGGLAPTYWKIYDGSVPFEARVDTVVNWLKLPLEKRPRFITLYFQEPDGIGHSFGPEHEETGKVIKELDGILGKLRKELSTLPYGNKVNLIVTSDHGMGEISSERYVNIYGVVNEAWVEADYGSDPVYLIDAVDEFVDTLAYTLNAAEGVTAWQKDEIPAYLHYGTHPRIPDIVAVADSGWSLGVREQKANSSYIGGTHGYDNTNSDMHAIFYAEGPAFKEDFVHKPFENVNVYILIAEILGLEPAETDGDIELVRDMLK